MFWRVRRPPPHERGREQRGFVPLRFSSPPLFWQRLPAFVGFICSSQPPRATRCRRPRANTAAALEVFGCDVAHTVDQLTPALKGILGGLGQQPTIYYHAKVNDKPWP